MKKQERLSRTFSFVIHRDVVEMNCFGFHDAHYGWEWQSKQSGKCT